MHPMSFPRLNLNFRSALLPLVLGEEQQVSSCTAAKFEDSVRVYDLRTGEKRPFLVPISRPTLVPRMRRSTQIVFAYEISVEIGEQTLFSLPFLPPVCLITRPGYSCSREPQTPFHNIPPGGLAVIVNLITF
ncbi:hypothetical protein LSTR_LSTR006902 [Laodelphax striatellus]|uniref:Uncharacterized protein n=1 Tax=Laodelphax striatellus TaxID=195883 RepID=A0A482WL65_LAOST|nr:hypothetical protein LSTR_LSTR006902 [Laodelphax striatellus]